MVDTQPLCARPASTAVVMAPGKRAAEPEPETEQSSKYRKVIDEGADELLCPITQELPLDPVTAEDGRVYERSAIEEWLATNEKSPHTNEPMGGMLFPATQVKNLIASMVRSGALSGDKAGAWKQKLEDEKVVEEYRRKAEAGDLQAMMQLGGIYRRGINGITADPAQCFKWTKRAADLDHPPGIAALATCYYHGFGASKNHPRTLVLLTQAATMGSGYACYVLALMYEHVMKSPLPKDLGYARYWAKKALDDGHVKFPMDEKFMASCCRLAADE